METKRALLIAGGALAAIFLQTAPARPQAEAQPASALSGQVTSAEEGPMEGVVVSAKKDGSTISISVATNAVGRFPRCETRTGTLHIERARSRL
jgi:hypothetical protein